MSKIKVKLTCLICNKSATYSYDDRKEPFWNVEDSARYPYIEHLMSAHPDKNDVKVKVEVVK